MNLEAVSSDAWARAVPILKDATVYIDNEAAQVVKWTHPGGAHQLLALGPASIRSLESAVEDQGKLRLPKSTRVVFIVSKHLALYEFVIREVLLSCSYHECFIITSLPLHAQEVELLQDTSLCEYFDNAGVQRSSTTDYFSAVEDVVYMWMTQSINKFEPSFNGSVTIKIEHIPLLWASITSDVFVVPSAVELFPTLKPGPLSSSADAHEINARHFSHSLSTILDSLNLREEFYVLGETSKRIAKSVIANSSLAARRSSDRNVAVILIDRNLDLVSPMQHSENILDQLYQVFPRVTPCSVDIAIPAEQLLDDAPELSDTAVFSLAHGMSVDSTGLLDELTALSQKEALGLIRNRLMDIVQHQNLALPNAAAKGTRALTPTELHAILQTIMQQDNAFVYENSAFLQTLAAAVAVIIKTRSSNWSDLLGIEKTTMLALSETMDSSVVIQQIASMLPRGDGRSQFTLEDTLDFTILVHALVGSTVSFSARDEQTLKEAFKRALLGPAQPHAQAKPKQPSTDGWETDWDVDFDSHLESFGDSQEYESPQRNSPQAAEVDRWIRDTFSTLKRIRAARSELKHFHSVLDPSSAELYKPLVQQVMETIFKGRPPPGQPDVSDLTHVPYPGSVIGGFSFSRLLGGAPHPSQFSSMIVVVVGGVTFAEANLIRGIALQNEVSSILVGGTDIATSRSVFSRLFTHPPGL
ncbi:uncharacterized protein BJ171DRAFT_509715 [Polychytrium aggregatum]|uniref:uncharacterized protein n=1 Tax=Polychytrium aggregatum TaxID=110093 RepID=UPI0022FE1672|nr:uncharacterized protein BJ171DRAFT_509715 [Polychytrium aggregatum]KAI9203471.1 hypothetical protein BJ171DRAFT_509715 [Polychytrium aggregatum]